MNESIFYSSAKTGVKAKISMAPSVFANMLITPTGVASPKPVSGVQACSTASSYATNKIGTIKNPMIQIVM